MSTMAAATAGRLWVMQRKASARVLVPRFDVHQRAQHLVMLTTFMTLAATGLPQKFGGYAPSRWWIDLMGGLDMIRTIHRTAGMIMLVDCVYHLGYVVTRLGFQRRYGMLRMIPTIEDAQNVLASFSYVLGLTRKRPQFDRFSYIEKFDYWAVFWGIAVIGMSGLLLMFPVQSASLLSSAALPAAKAAHSDEALLAVGWIFTVHLFYVFLAPEAFPLNAAMFTGRMPVHRYRQAHPLELQRLLASAPALRSEGGRRFLRRTSPPRATGPAGPDGRGGRVKRRPPDGAPGVGRGRRTP